MPQDKNWKSHIRPAALDRAKHCCEECSVPQGTVGWWDEFGVFHIIDDPNMISVMLHLRKGVRVNDVVNVIKIILFVRHLDHDKTNNQPNNLKVLCQRCHLMYDREHQAKMRRINRRKREMAREQMAFEI